MQRSALQCILKTKQNFIKDFSFFSPMIRYYDDKDGDDDENQNHVFFYLAFTICTTRHQAKPAKADDNGNMGNGKYLKTNFMVN